MKNRQIYKKRRLSNELTVNRQRYQAMMQLKSMNEGS